MITYATLKYGSAKVLAKKCLDETIKLLNPNDNEWVIADETGLSAIANYVECDDGSDDASKLLDAIDSDYALVNNITGSFEEPSEHTYFD